MTPEQIFKKCCDVGIRIWADETHIHFDDSELMEKTPGLYDAMVACGKPLKEYLFARQASEKMTYREQLRDPRWQRKRLEVLQRDNFCCVACKRGDKTLEVHHVIYTRYSKIWEYSMECYQTFCSDCHETRQDLADNAANALKLALKHIPTERMAEVGQWLATRALEEIY